MRKRIGIITLYGENYNYGGLLQAYALQKSIENMGNECEIINYRRSKGRYWVKRFINIGFKKSFEQVKNKIITKIVYKNNPVLKKNISERDSFFNEFELMIPHTGKVYKKELFEICKTYDVLVCGSDQIWNPGLWDDVMFLDIPRLEKKKIAYAASIGRSVLKNSEKKYMQEKLKNINFISVREKSAENLIAEIPGISAVTVLDPTFLLKKEEWEKIAIRPESCPDEYIFAFFLGENFALKKKIQEICIKRNMPLVTIPHLQTGFKAEDEKYGDVHLYNIGPCEWVWLILNAKFIFTDSFHGTAFSVNLNKRFLSIAKNKINDKQSINARLFDLLDMLGLADRFVYGEDICDEIIKSDIDYKPVNKKVEFERQKSFEFLGGAL